MMRRKAYDRLMEWKNGPGHKCLVVKGQRQVGKTFLIKRFAEENYRTVIYSDLSTDMDMRDALSKSTVDEIVNTIKLKRGILDIDIGTTVFVFDEIQSSARARSSLKLFSNDERGFNVIASGSLLGVTNPNKRKDRRKKKRDGEKKEKEDGYNITDEKSLVEALEREEEENESVSILPMGYEDHLTMYSMDFEEFLWALDVPQDSIDEVKSCIHKRRPLNDTLLKTMDRHFRDYMIVGGLPESVKAFVEGNGDYMAAGKAISDALELCLSDFDNYSEPIDPEKIRDCFFSIPVMLSESNKKFMFSKIRRHEDNADDSGDDTKGTSATYNTSLIWLKQAGYTNFCFNLNDLTHPIELSVNRKSFKVYMSDTGMLNSLLGVDSMRATYSWDTKYNKGAIVENAVAEGIRKSGVRVRYYKSTENKDDRRMEIDFILEFGRDLIAVEVKSGKDIEAPSLGKVRKTFSQVNRRVMLSRSNIFTDKDGVEHYPIFAACFVKELAKDWDGPKFYAFTE